MKLSAISYTTLAILFFTTISLAELNAAATTPPPSEEDICFSILSEQVLSQYGVDLSRAKKSEKNNTTWNLSLYSEFRKNRNIGSDNNAFFDARRNNIGTIIAGSNYMRSQFISFGDNTNFTFPLKTQPGITSLGETYPDFRNNIMYTHHLINTGDLVSCGYLRISPKGDNTLSDLSQQNYMTNTLDDSGFEIINENKIVNGKRYLIGKVVVGAIGYDMNPLFRIELMTVAYDNQSSIFNEYETFPIQVRAMTNPDSTSQGINAVQLTFLRGVRDETCLEIPHASKDELPDFCNGQYKSLSKEKPITQSKNTPTKTILALIIDWFIPNASARLSEDEVDSSVATPRGIYLGEAVSLNLQEKIDSIPNPNLRDYIRVALTPNFEEYIKNRQSQNIILTPFEKTFIECGIPYSKRVDIITQWITELDISKFDIENIRYPDPRIGDCILPFPDVRNKSTVIPGSFDTNQFYAKILTEGTGSIPQVSSEDQLRINSILLAQEYDRLIQEAKLNDSSRVESLIKERDIALKAIGGTTTTINTTFNSKHYYIGGILLFFGLLLTVFLIRKKPIPAQSK